MPKKNYKDQDRKSNSTTNSNRSLKSVITDAWSSLKLQIAKHRNPTVEFWGIVLSIFAFIIYRMILAKNRAISRVKSTILEADDIQRSSYTNGMRIYFNTSSIHYSKLSDDEFGITINGGFLSRKVEYCQWTESSISKEREDSDGNKHTEYEYYYTKIWSSHQISSFFFHNPGYSNPHVTNIPRYDYHGKISTNLYQIAKNLSTDEDNSQILKLNKGQKRSFKQSDESSEFQYIGKGIFYRPFHPSFLRQVIQVASIFDTKSHTLSLNSCEPGDTRVWFEFWAPSSVSILGERNGNVIQPFVDNGVKFGGIFAGYHSLDSILSKSYDYNKNFISKFIHKTISSIRSFDISKQLSPIKDFIMNF